MIASTRRRARNTSMHVAAVRGELQVYGLVVRPGQHANPLRQLWHELADRGEGLRSHWCSYPTLLHAFLTSCPDCGHRIH
jgi:hypothetical protein